MSTCPSCRESCVNGSILCLHCGADLDEPITLKDPSRLEARYLPVQGVPQDVVLDEPTITLHVIEVDGTRFSEGQRSSRPIPLRCLEVPVRIGRRDLTKSPPIVPEIDLTEILKECMRRGNSQFVSRLHAALQLEDGRVMLKPVVPHSRSTRVRHTGRSDYVTIPESQRYPLQDRDVIVLGYPDAGCVQLRVSFSHIY